MTTPADSRHQAPVDPGDDEANTKANEAENADTDTEETAAPEREDD